MISKYLVSLLLITSPVISVAQSTYTEALTKLVTWFRSLDDIVSNIEETEKLREMHYTLGYLNSDIDNLALEKAHLSRMISRYAAESSTVTIDQVNSQVQIVVENLASLESRLRKFRILVNSSQQVAIGQLVADIENLVVTRKQVHIEDLKQKLSQGPAFKNEMKLEADRALLVSKDISRLIRAAKAQIVKKLS